MAAMRVFVLAVILMALIITSLEISHKHNLRTAYEVLLVRQVHT